MDDKAANRHWAQTVTQSIGLRGMRVDARLFLNDHEVPARRVDDIILTLSELASNALSASVGPEALVVVELDLASSSIIKVRLRTVRRHN